MGEGVFRFDQIDQIGIKKFLRFWDDRIIIQSTYLFATL